MYRFCILLLVSVFLTIIATTTISAETELERACSRVRTLGERWFGIAYTDADEVYARVYIGNICFAADAARLQRAGITHIVPAAREWGRLHTDLFEYCSMESPLEDGDDANLTYWLHAAQFINETLEADANARVLVHCNMGISRSSAVVLAYLMTYQNLQLAEAATVLKNGRVVAEPNLFYWEKLQELSQEC